jgi:hypothetical protein
MCLCSVPVFYDAVDNGFDTSADDSTAIVSVTWSDDVMTCRHGHHFGLGVSRTSAYNPPCGWPCFSRAPKFGAWRVVVGGPWTSGPVAPNSG